MIHEGDAYLREREMERLPAAVLPSRLKIEVVAPEERICERLTDCGAAVDAGQGQGTDSVRRHNRKPECEAIGTVELGNG